MGGVPLIPCTIVSIWSNRRSRVSLREQSRFACLANYQFCVPGALCSCPLPRRPGHYLRISLPVSAHTLGRDFVISFGRVRMTPVQRFVGVSPRFDLSLMSQARCDSLPIESGLHSKLEVRSPTY